MNDHSTSNLDNVSSQNTLNDFNHLALKYQDEFPHQHGLCYLNHAAVAPWPKRSSEAVINFSQQNCQRGATDYLSWMDTEHSLRGALAQLIGCANSDHLALVKNTSEALSILAYGLDWTAGDVVVIGDDEFPSNRIVWESLAEKFGVIVQQVGIPTGNPEKELLDAIEQQPKLISISAVQYASGIRLDLKKLGLACKQHDVLFCVDAIQAVGAMPFEVDEWLIDFAMADGHKWMLGPEGLGFFFVAKQHIKKLKLHQYGWHMIENIGDYTQRQWQPANTARRFECGSPNNLATQGLLASTELLLEAGLDKVEQSIEANHHYLYEKIAQLGAHFISPFEPNKRSGILTFHFHGHDSSELYQALMKRQVICAHRGGGVRFSPHFYTTQACMDEAVAVLAELLKS